MWGESSEVQQVVRYNSSGVVIRTFGTAGGGRGAGQMYYPHDAMLMPDGLILVSDGENGRFVAFRQDGSVAWTTRQVVVPAGQDDVVGAGHPLCDRWFSQRGP